HRHGTLELEAIEAAIGGAAVPVELLARLHRDVLHETAGRVAPEQRALRSAQQLDAIDVEEQEPGARHLADVDLVDIYGDRALDVGDEVAAGDAADGDRVVRLAVRLQGADAGRER